MIELGSETVNELRLRRSLVLRRICETRSQVNLILVAIIFHFTLMPNAYSAKLLNIMSVSGRCDRLVALKIDLTDECKGILGSNIFDDSRNSFTFTSQPKDKAPIFLAFSGLGKGQVKPDADTATQPVDLLITGLDGKPILDKAVGFCTFRNPYKPGFTVRCVAETVDGHYEARFTGDGSQPSLMRPR